MMIGIAMPIDLQSIDGYTAVARIFLPDTTVLAASDLSLETNTLVVPNDAELTPVLSPQISVTVTETVQVSDGQQATSHPPLHAVKSLYLSETSIYQRIPNIISGFGSSPDSTQSPQAIFVDFALNQASRDYKTLRAAIITISESVVISETSRLILPVSILVYEGVVVSDIAKGVLPVLITINESVVISETSRLILPVSILVYEGVVVSDIAKGVLPVLITINESIGVHDATQPDTASKRATGEVLAATNADINQDREVDGKDLDLLRASYRCSENEMGFNSDADLNRDGWVDLRDLAMFGAFYGR